MNKVAAFALRRKNSILSMSEKMFCPPQPLRLVWITPACAGKSKFRMQTSAEARDHPRVCGEKICVKLSLKSLFGSPPRMRGKVSRYLWPGLPVRITPACAGKRYRYSARTIPRRDHPRVCGEKIASWTVCKVSMGSPPRMRGKAQAEQPLPHVAGITPACAGKSRTRSEWQSLIKDHPRACGEKNLERVVPRRKQDHPRACGEKPLPANRR